MKKITLLLLALITIQCSKNDDSNNTQQVTVSSCINPPIWLQGTWVNYSLSEPTVVESKYVITANNITSYNYSESSTSWKDLYCGKSPLITTEESNKSGYYFFQWTQVYAGTTIQNPCYFIKQSQPNKMEFNNYLDDDGGIIYTKL